MYIDSSGIALASSRREDDAQSIQNPVESTRRCIHSSRIPRLSSINLSRLRDEGFYPTPQCLQDRVILAARNSDVFINDLCLQKFPGEERIYSSANIVVLLRKARILSSCHPPPPNRYRKIPWSPHRRMTCSNLSYEVMRFGFTVPATRKITYRYFPPIVIAFGLIFTVFVTLVAVGYEPSADLSISFNATNRS